MMRVLSPQSTVGDGGGKAYALTVITPIRFGWGVPTRVLLWFLHLRIPPLRMKAAGHLRLIHFGRWTVLPGRQIGEDPKRSYLLFSAVYNGPWDQYIDAFSLVARIRTGVNSLWFTSRGFPGARRLMEFKRYIRYFEVVPDAFYNAYPEATVRDINAALELRKAFECEVSRGRDDKHAVRRFYRDNGHRLRSASVAGSPSPVNARPMEDS